MCVAHYLQKYLNSTLQIKNYQKFTSKEMAGHWSDLFRAVIEDSIDIAIAITKPDDERDRDMDFTHKILDSM